MTHQHHDGESGDGESGDGESGKNNCVIESGLYLVLDDDLAEPVSEHHPVERLLGLHTPRKTRTCRCQTAGEERVRRQDLLKSRNSNR